MRFSRTHGMRGLGEFFWDDSFTPDFPDYFFDSPLVEVSAPDQVFTGRSEVLEYNAPVIYDLPSQNAITLVSQGYTRDPERSGGSSIYSGTTRTLATLGQDATDYEADEVAARAGNGQVADPAADIVDPLSYSPGYLRPALEYADSRAGQSSFIKDAVTAIPAAFKAVTEYDLARRRLEIEKARTVPGRPLSTARAPGASGGGGAFGGGSGWQTPALLALGAAGLFLLLRRR